MLSLFENLHQAALSGYQMIDQISDRLTVVYRAVLNISLMVQDLGQPVQELEERHAVIERLSNQLKLQAMNATLEASQTGEADQRLAMVGEQVYALARQLAAEMVQLRPSICCLRTGIQDVVLEIVENQHHISDGRGLGRTLKRDVTQLLALPESDRCFDRSPESSDGSTRAPDPNGRTSSR